MNMHTRQAFPYLPIGRAQASLWIVLSLGWDLVGIESFSYTGPKILHKK